MEEYVKYPEVVTVIVACIIIFWVLVASVIYFMVQYQKRKMEHLKENVELRANVEKEILQSRIEIQEQAFNSISRELHDNIGHDLSLAKLNLNTLREISNNEVEKINEVKALITNSIDQIRNISRTLLGEKVSRIGFVEAVKNEIERIKKLGIMEVELSLPHQAVSFDNQKEVILFRIVQEALNNILKHSGASKATVSIRFQENTLKILIQDNGKGFKLVDESNAGVGLMNMKNRAQTIGAVLRFESSIGNGTVVEIVLKTPTDD